MYSSTIHFNILIVIILFRFSVGNLVTIIAKNKMKPTRFDSDVKATNSCIYCHIDTMLKLVNNNTSLEYQNIHTFFFELHS